MLNFSLRQRAPVILQNEAAECGLACLAMVAGYHGHQIDLATLRARHTISLRGSTLADLIQLAGLLKFNSRPLRLDLEHMPELKLPCVLHWDFNHFVVLTKVYSNRVLIQDPAIGERELPIAEFSKHFTGIALELTPTNEFIPRVDIRKVKLTSLIGRMQGIGSTVAQVLILALVLQFFAILAPFYMQWIVDQALVTQDYDLVTVLGIGFLLLAVVQASVTALRAWILMVLGTTLNLQMISNMFQHLIRLPMSWFNKRHIGDIVSRFESLNVIQRTLTTGFLEALIDGVMVIVTFCVMLFYSLQLTLVALIAASLYALLRFALYRPLRLATEEHIVRGAKQQSHFIETARGMQSIKLFAHEVPRTAAWQNLVVDQYNASIRTQRLGILYQGLNGLLFGIENVITIWLGALLVLDTANGAGFSIGMLFAFVAYKTQFVQRVAALIEKGIELRMLGLHTERVGDIALTIPEPHDDSSISKSIPLEGRIEVKNVTFRHTETDPLVLQDVSFSVQAGESIAIVGPSGCGKTTLVKLMLGLLHPNDGTIEVDGQSLSRIGVKYYRNHVASVMQDDQLFAGSISENICFFDPRPDFERIEACTRLASIHDDIAAMPMQYNTLVGDMGTVLSGGQKQRLLLARALYRQPKILFLDEATSHLDVARESSVNEAISKLKLTRIIVAHRPETIASADRVITLSDGKVISDVSAIHSIQSKETN
ncbi:MAG: peptidase domain-containing ABC transporter [Burkholderiales bacterium]|nr:peptidase domain-containing ABC transporter [Burkholderiales bacterium]MDR4516979.1 peptidase domain-containing ABC transporter [Nitrosomonas sp.]